MDKHTFKIGDRVFGQSWIDDKNKVPGVFVKIGGIVSEGCIIRRDDGVSGIEPGLCWYCKHLTTHDTDFQVGDWVRYEGVEDGHVPELEGEVGIVTCNSGFSSVGVKFPAHWNPDALWNKANLVKIQPPQEESDNTIVHVFTSYTNKEDKKMRNVFNITHEKYGVVHGVHQVAPGCYCKNGAHYYHGEGWRETEEWVKIKVRKSEWETINTQTGTFEAWGLDDDCHAVSWRPAK